MAHETVTPDPRELQRAEDTWTSFTKVSKWVVILSCITLIVLGAFTIRW